ncbi:Heat shock factor protein [Trichinella pseudospiralis]
MRNEELKDNSDVAWSNALKFAQMNSVRHRVLNRLLYQALYGCNLMQNACKDHIPSEILRQADGEEELGNVIIQFRSECEVLSSRKTAKLIRVMILEEEWNNVNG